MSPDRTHTDRVLDAMALLVRTTREPNVALRRIADVAGLPCADTYAALMSLEAVGKVQDPTDLPWRERRYRLTISPYCDSGTPQGELPQFETLVVAGDRVFLRGPDGRTWSAAPTEY